MGDDAAAAGDVCDVLDAEAVKLARDDGGGAVFLVGELGVAVEVVPESDDFREDFADERLEFGGHQEV